MSEYFRVKGHAACLSYAIMEVAGVSPNHSQRAMSVGTTPCGRTHRETLRMIEVNSRHVINMRHGLPTSPNRNNICGEKCAGVQRQHAGQAQAHSQPNPQQIGNADQLIFLSPFQGIY